MLRGALWPQHLCMTPPQCWHSQRLLRSLLRLESVPQRRTSRRTFRQGSTWTRRWQRWWRWLSSLKAEWGRGTIWRWRGLLYRQTSRPHQWRTWMSNRSSETGLHLGQPQIAHPSGSFPRQRHSLLHSCLRILWLCCAFNASQLFCEQFFELQVTTGRGMSILLLPRRLAVLSLPSDLIQSNWSNLI